VTKPVLVSVASPQTIFRFFETSNEDASWNKLHESTNFMILGATFQKLWMFEVLGRIWPGRACAEANQQELTNATKSRR
jgi:hypothetical protein